MRHDLLPTGHPDPFVRHHLDPAAVVAARGAAVVATVADGRVLVGSGDPDDLDPLLAGVLADPAATAPLERVMVEHTSHEALPERWRPRPGRAWHWMLTTELPPATSATVVEVRDAATVDAVLDRGNPGSHARPTTPGLECWLGLVEDDEVVAVGALARQPDGTGNLRGVTVLPECAGRGLGTALSTALTRRALGVGAPRSSGVATLGVFTDNAPALAVYRRLGYTTRKTFVSGPLSRTR